MKRTLSIVTIFLVCLLLPVVWASNDALKIDVNVAEEIIQPGETINFRMTFTNLGDKGISDLKYEIIAGTKISGYPSGEVFIGGVSPGNVMIREVPLSVSGDAETGTYTISIRAKYTIEQVEYKAIKNYKFKVGSNIVLHLEKVEFEPEELEPGKTVKIFAYVKNVGSDDAVQLIAEFETNNTSDIRPILAGATDFIKSIPSEKTATFEFLASVDSSAESKTYPAEIKIDYEDSEGNSFLDKFDTGLPVTGTPNIVILNTKVDEGKLEVEVENLGTAKAKAIKMELVQDGNVMDVDIDNELKADKHTTLRFKTFKAGIATLELSYLDDSNNEYTESITISVASSSVEKKVKVSVTSVVLIIIVVVEAFYIYKLRKRQRTK